MNCDLRCRKAMVDCESLRKLAGIATRRPKNLPMVFVLVGIVGPGWFLEFDEGKDDGRCDGRRTDESC